DAVGGGVEGGQHQDRNVVVAAEAAADLHAVETGEHDVEDGEVGRAGAGAGEGGGTVGGDGDLVALVDEGATERRRDAGGVVHHEDVDRSRLSCHRCYSSTGG